MGQFLVLAELLLLAMLVRPWRCILDATGAFAVGAVLAIGASMAVARLPGVMEHGAGFEVLGTAVGPGHLLFGVDNLLEDLGRVPRVCGMQAMSVPGSAATRALLLLVPLVTCMRYDSLLERPDTRDVLVSLLPRVAGTDRPALVDARLLLTGQPLPAGISAFPPGQDDRPWVRKQTTPRATFVKAGASLYARPRDRNAPCGLGADELGLLGDQRYGVLASAPAVASPRAGALPLPDLPAAAVVDVWTTWRLGPPIEFWVRGEEARAALARVAPPESLATYSP